MTYTRGNVMRWPMACQHPRLQPLPGGTVHRVLIQSQGTVRGVLVAGFPADYCLQCLAQLTDLSWELAVQQELERREAVGIVIGQVVNFADLQLRQPAVLSA